MFFFNLVLILLLFLRCQLSSHTFLQLFSHILLSILFRILVPFSQQIGQFGNHTLYCHILSTDDPQISKDFASFIDILIHFVFVALRNIDDNDSFFTGFLQFAKQFCVLAGKIARTKRFDYYGFYVFSVQNIVQDLLIEYWRILEDPYFIRQRCEKSGFFGFIRNYYVFPCDFVVDSQLDQWFVIGTIEAIETFTMCFPASVSSEYLVFK